LEAYIVMSTEANALWNVAESTLKIARAQNVSQKTYPQSLDPFRVHNPQNLFFVLS
jgi:hypothetical protein